MKHAIHHIHFVGIGGSGMLPLAMIVQAQGNRIAGSDRALDQGRTPDKFDWLRAHGVTLHPDTAAFLARPRRMLIGGEWVEAASGVTTTLAGAADQVGTGMVAAATTTAPAAATRAGSGTPR